MANENPEQNLAVSADNNAKLAELLTSWGLGSYVDKFLRNKLDIEHLCNLSENDLKELIEPIAHRIIFRNKRDAHFKIGSTSDGSNKRKERTNEEACQNQPVPKKASVDIVDPTSVLAQLRPLREVLNEYPGTQQILIKFDKTKLLTDRQRNIVVDTYVKELATITTEATNPVHKGVSKKICEGLPGEILETYYVSPIKKCNSLKGTSEPSSAKVPNKWRNLVAKWKRDSKADENPEVESEQETPEDVNDDAAYEVVLKYFNENSNLVIDTVQTKYESVAPKRLASFKMNGNDVDVSLGVWKILNQPDAFSLVHSDFKSAALTKKDPKIEDWNEIFDLLKVICQDKLNEANTKLLLNHLDTPGLSVDSTTRDQLEIMCRLLPPSAVGPIKKGEIPSEKKRWKASVANCYESIVEHTVRAVDIEDLRDEKTPLKESKPYIITTGANPKEPTDFYVCIGKALYKLPSFFEAFKICFEAYHVFSMTYPPASEHLWLILQKKLYSFGQNKKSKVSNVETIVNSLTQLMKENDTGSESSDEDDE